MREMGHSQCGHRTRSSTSDVHTTTSVLAVEVMGDSLDIVTVTSAIVATNGQPLRQDYQHVFPVEIWHVFGNFFIPNCTELHRRPEWVWPCSEFLLQKLDSMPQSFWGMQRFRNRFSCFGASDRQWNASLATDVSVPAIPPGLTCRWCQLDSFLWLPPCLVGTRLMPNSARMKCKICVTHPNLFLEQHKNPPHIETKIQFVKTPFSFKLRDCRSHCIAFQILNMSLFDWVLLVVSILIPCKPCILLEIWVVVEYQGCTEN